MDNKKWWKNWIKWAAMRIISHHAIVQSQNALLSNIPWKWRKKIIQKRIFLTREGEEMRKSVKIF
jgi:hypothetical protein